MHPIFKTNPDPSMFNGSGKKPFYWTRVTDLECPYPWPEYREWFFSTADARSEREDEDLDDGTDWQGINYRTDVYMKEDLEKLINEYRNPEKVANLPTEAEVALERLEWDKYGMGYGWKDICGCHGYVVWHHTFSQYCLRDPHRREKNLSDDQLCIHQVIAEIRANVGPKNPEVFAHMEWRMKALSFIRFNPSFFEIPGEPGRVANEEGRTFDFQYGEITLCSGQTSTKDGTTTVALNYGDGIAIAADSRMTRDGSSEVIRDVEKIWSINNNLAVSTAGSARFSSLYLKDLVDYITEYSETHSKTLPTTKDSAGQLLKIYEQYKFKKGKNENHLADGITRNHRLR